MGYARPDLTVIFHSFTCKKALQAKLEVEAKEEEKKLKEMEKKFQVTIF